MNRHVNAELRKFAKPHGLWFGNYRTSVLALALLMADVTVMHAQFLGQLSGTIHDSSGAVVPGASVTLKNQSSGTTRDTTSNGEGYFTIAAVPTGTYTLTVRVKGFKSSEQADIALDQGDKRSVETVLQVGEG